MFMEKLSKKKTELLENNAQLTLYFVPLNY